MLHKRRETDVNRENADWEGEKKTAQKTERILKRGRCCGLKISEELKCVQFHHKVNRECWVSLLCSKPSSYFRIAMVRQRAFSNWTRRGLYTTHESLCKAQNFYLPTPLSCTWLPRFRLSLVRLTRNPIQYQLSSVPLTRQPITASWQCTREFERCQQDR